ncbi:MAG: deoxyribodipyrimidine photo-lyase [Mycolicibacterium sp.]|uniref:cryptochrome/photolyase family protein n=1 Tax=Mycolicibacterium sp. TaxID=2320850 RepID=UPI003D0A1D7F
MPSILWFRRDLRLADLPALLTAAQGEGADGEVLACYVLDPRLTASAPRRLQYLYDALRELRDALEGRLLVTVGHPESRIPLLARAIDAKSVHISKDFSPFGRRRDQRVAEALGDVELVATGSPYLVSPGRVRKPDGTAYQVFTPFFKAWRGHGWRSPAESGPHSARWINPADVPSCPEICELPCRTAELEIAAGEQAARRQWGRFIRTGLDGYADARNRPDLDAVSRMSAHLKFGTIHPRTMAADLGRAQGPQAYLRELAFRDFYAAVLYEWPESAWRNWNSAFDQIEIDEDKDAERLFEAWKSGRTGFPIVDAGMRQLAETGFMHNRVRMIVASFLVKDLHLPWQWGARWFLDQLVDGDIASNQHGWQWAAGCGTDAAPYFRVFNPTTQGEKFDPCGRYVRRWVRELTNLDEAVDVHQLSDPRVARPHGYPDPIVDHAQERMESLRRYQALKR